MASTRLDAPDWTERQRLHHARVDPWIQPHLERARRREPHPVHDFLFTYYSHRPGQLRRWHPGVGVTLSGAAPHRDWPGYRETGDGITADVDAFLARRGSSVQYLTGLLKATAARRPMFGCFGLHEWAMVYRSEENRHASWSLRLSEAEVAQVVEAAPLRCTHYDAFRFFTTEARPHNVLTLTRESAPEHEQGGCLHANMDLYKIAYKITPLLPSELIADCFELAREIRELDMRAGPYDLSALGYPAVAIETTAGRAEYAAAQQGFAERAAALRQRLIEWVEPLTAMG